MINNVLTGIKDKLNDYFKQITASEAEHVAYLDGKKTDPLIFPDNSVVPMLVNIEEEKIIRQANRYEVINRNGMLAEAMPSVGINLWVLFIANFTDYDQALQFLSLVIAYFQKTPVFNHTNLPALPGAIDKIIAELTTMPIGQRNELWTSLKTTYRPSVLYKMGVLVYRDDTADAVMPTVKERIVITKLQ